MMCDECRKRPACVHITKVHNNQKVELHLCEYCAQAAGEGPFAVDGGFSVNDLLKGLFKQGYGEAPPKQRLVCDNCGLSYADFSQSGKIGCSTCYTTFAERLEQMLRRIHGANAHTGKVPRRSGGAMRVRQQLKQLKRQLDGHVAREEYESAAKLRDEIRALERQLTSAKEGAGQ